MSSHSPIDNNALMATQVQVGESHRKAHLIECKSRTEDIVADEQVPFSSLLLSKKVLDGLLSCGYERPSPIQLKAIPLAKCGSDMVVQAKSGTGKTCVFAVAALESLQVQIKNLQVLILAPTREIACQIHDVVSAIGLPFDKLGCEKFIGGTSVDEEKKKLKGLQIAIGTPGRIKQLIELKWLDVTSVRLFVLDEADKLLEEGSFQEQINWIFSTLPENKQVLALSATYPVTMDAMLANYMNGPVHVRLTSDGLTLAGVRQFYVSVPEHRLPHVVFESKVKSLIKILESISFQQCLVFSNYRSRAEHVCNLLDNKGWPSTFISGSQAQETRQKSITQLRDFKCRILITTDLISRGIDCDKVNLVFNLDLPWDTETYLHRVGRAGRFGAYGLAINLMSVGSEMAALNRISKEIGLAIERLPDGLHEISQLLFLMQEKTSQADMRPSSAEVLYAGQEGPCSVTPGAKRLSPDGEQTAEERMSSVHAEISVEALGEESSSSSSTCTPVERKLVSQIEGFSVVNEQGRSFGSQAETCLNSFNREDGFKGPQDHPHRTGLQRCTNGVLKQGMDACPFCLFGVSACCGAAAQNEWSHGPVKCTDVERYHPDGCDDHSEGLHEERGDTEEPEDSGQGQDFCDPEAVFLDGRDIMELIDANVAINMKEDADSERTQRLLNSGFGCSFPDDEFQVGHSLLEGERMMASQTSNCSAPQEGMQKVSTSGHIWSEVEEECERAANKQNFQDLSILEFGEFCVDTVLPILPEVREKYGRSDNRSPGVESSSQCRLPSEIEFERVFGQFIKSSKLDDLVDDSEVADNVFEGVEDDSGSDTGSEAVPIPRISLGSSLSRDTSSISNDSSDSHLSGEFSDSHGAPKQQAHNEEFLFCDKAKVMSTVSPSSDYDSSSSSYLSSSFDSQSDASTDRSQGVRSAGEYRRAVSSTGILAKTKLDLRRLTFTDSYRSGSEHLSETDFDEFILIPLESPRSAFAQVKGIDRTQGGTNSETSSRRSSKRSNRSHSAKEVPQVCAMTSHPKSSVSVSDTLKHDGVRAARPDQRTEFTSSSSLQLCDVSKMMEAWGNSYRNYCGYMDSYLNWARAVRGGSWRR